jgi:hypothetical protein
MSVWIGGQGPIGKAGAASRRVESACVMALLLPHRLVCRYPYQAPVFGMDAHGSAGGSAAFFWMSSMEMPSGERMKAM